jgi:hypothetical protein
MSGWLQASRTGVRPSTLAADEIAHRTRLTRPGAAMMGAVRDASSTRRRIVVVVLVALLVLAGAGDGGALPEPGRLPARSATAASGVPDRAARPGASGVRWRPPLHATWQWQLTTPVDRSVDAETFDIDLFDNPRWVVADLRRRERHVVCYVSAGSLEAWRPDARSFPAAVVGRPLVGWPGERWLDIRRLDLLAPLLERRLDLCRAKGFDGVEADNVDGYVNATGFALTARDQLRFNRFLARAAHARGLSIGLKNDLAQARLLEPSFDWALSEECFRYAECHLLAPFTRAGKAVIAVEYVAPRRFCAKARALGFMAMLKRPGLDAGRRACW